MNSAMPNLIDWDYVEERIRRYNANPSDDLLYRIGTHVNILTPQDSDLIQCQQNVCLNPEQRYRVLDWIVSRYINQFQLKCDLALLIFGREQLTQWLECSRQAYPDFEFYLVFEYMTEFQTGYNDGICFSMYWRPKAGAPQPNFSCDFPWKMYWESGDMFWCEWMTGGNQFYFNLDCYPNQQSFAVSNGFCEENDYFTTPTEREAKFMSVAQVLEHF